MGRQVEKGGGVVTYWRAEPDPKLKGRFTVDTGGDIQAMPIFVGGYFRNRDDRYVLTAAQKRKAERLIDAGWRCEHNRYYADDPVAWHPRHEDQFERDELADLLEALPPEPHRCGRTMELPL